MKIVTAVVEDPTVININIMWNHHMKIRKISTVIVSRNLT